jgi:hypothetical protein
MHGLMTQGRWLPPHKQHDTGVVPRSVPLLRIADTRTGGQQMGVLDMTWQHLPPILLYPYVAAMA